MGNSNEAVLAVLNNNTITPILVNITNNNNAEHNKEITPWSISKIIKRSNFQYLLGNKSKTPNKHSEFINFLEQNKLKDKLKEIDISDIHNKTKLASNLSYNQILAICLYNHIENKMNESFNIQIDTWAIFCGCLLSGLNKLPFQYDTPTVYRSIPPKDYTIGNLIRFDQFVATTESKKSFNTNGYILEIQNCFRGRDISTFILQKPKTEILFNISSYFMISKIYTSYPNTYVRCTEIPIPYSPKTVIWVDDNPRNNHKLMHQFERNGIMIVPQLSTKGTLKYLDTIRNIIDENMLNKFRIISDMYRFEYVDDDKSNEKVVDKQAGIRLIKELRKRNYFNRICIFTSNENSILDYGLGDNVIVTAHESVIKRFGTFERMDYVSMEKYIEELKLFPKVVNGLIIEFLDIKRLILNGNVCVKLRYNNGDDYFGNFWEESIVFNDKIDGENERNLKHNQRIGVVSHYNIHRMSNEKIFTEKETKFIFEISDALIPEWRIDFLNCDKNVITQKKIKMISEMECEYVNKMDCIKVSLYEGDNVNEIDEYFRKEILIPCDNLLEIFSNETDKVKEFTIWNEYTESNPHLYECADLTVINGYQTDPLNVNENT